MKTISVSELKNLIDAKQNIQIIDVRSKEEWQQGHINSNKVVNINVNDLLLNRQQIDTSKEIYVICASGGRSSVAQVLLNSIGINSVNVAGGMNEWVSKGYQTIS